MASPEEPAVRLSVVVASRADERGSPECLAAVVSQQTAGVEVILATDRADSPSNGGCADRDEAGVLVVSRPGALIPELWSAGIRASSGARVALLADTVVPASDWVGRLLAMAEEAPAGWGGPFEPSRRWWSVADSAVLFCRYSRHLLPVPTPGPDVAADNACYRRDALDAVAATWAEGFWEPFVHAGLRDRGESVVVSDGPVVAVAPGRSIRALTRQRLAHGREHAHRVAAQGAAPWPRVAAAPLVPLVLVARQGREVFARRRLRLRFVVAVPVLLWCAGWWAAGEAHGYLDAARGHGTAGPAPDGPTA